METCFIEVSTEDLERVTGGNFLPNLHSQSEYASVGITVVSHFSQMMNSGGMAKRSGIITRTPCTFTGRKKAVCPSQLQKLFVTMRAYVQTAAIIAAESNARPV